MIIGTVAGDIHDLGKNLVRLLFEGAGFRVIDLGTNVTAGKFLQAYQEEKADLIGLSSLLTTTMLEMEKVIKEVRDAEPQARFIIGGAPITKEFAEKIGANGYAPDAPTAVKVGKNLLAI